MWTCLVESGIYLILKKMEVEPKLLDVTIPLRYHNYIKSQIMPTTIIYFPKVTSHRDSIKFNTLRIYIFFSGISGHASKHLRKHCHLMTLALDKVWACLCDWLLEQVISPTCIPKDHALLHSLKTSAPYLAVSNPHFSL